MSNDCVYNCKYCINRATNDTPRTSFDPRELAELTLSFYRRNYIEGLFLSSGVVNNPNYTTELMINTLYILRHEYKFNGYIHAKAIPGTDSELITRLGYLADRMSINIELPSQKSLQLLAPNKSGQSILNRMGHIKRGIEENKYDLVKYKNSPKFVPGGQSTQIMIGATPESDYKIMTLSENLYKKHKLKRVFYSAYTPVVEHSLLPAMNTPPPLMREHRLYQADWLLRFYGFQTNELLDEQNPNFNPLVDPKCNWALNHMDMFPVEVNRASKDMLLRVPGIGVTGTNRILGARRSSSLDFPHLKKMGIVLKRAQYFITCKGKISPGLKMTPDNVINSLISDRCQQFVMPKQITLFDNQEYERLFENFDRKSISLGTMVT